MSENPDILALTQAVDKAADELHERHADDLTFVPEWRPLELAIPAAELDGWMFMNRNTGPLPVPGRPDPDSDIISYKHGISRKGLHLDARGMAWLPRWGGQLDNTRWEGPIPAEMVLRAQGGHYQVLAELGEDPGTAYDDDYRAERNRRLRAAGFTVIDARI